MISKEKYANIINSDYNKIYYSDDTLFFRDDIAHNEKDIIYPQPFPWFIDILLLITELVIGGVIILLSL